MSESSHIMCDVSPDFLMRAANVPMANFQLPDSLEACQALLAKLSQEFESQQRTLQSQEQTLQSQKQTIDSHETTITELHQIYQELQLAYHELLQRAFRNRSERYLDNPNQLRLDFQDTDEAADAAAGLAEALEEPEQEARRRTSRRRTRPNPRSGPFPAHLPRYEVIADVPEEQKVCEEHGPKKFIGYDILETLEFGRPQLRVRVTKYPKYACPDESLCGVLSLQRPKSLVEGNRYDTSVATEVITGKYAYHLPIYREQDYFAGCGWAPSRSTLLNLLVASAGVIRPLIQYFGDLVVQSGRIGTDDTSTTLLLPAKIPEPQPGDRKSQRIHEVLTQARAEGKTSVPGRMWIDRSMTVPLNVFDFTVSHHRDGPDGFLENFHGTLLGDCYTGYQGIEVRSDHTIRRAACVSHARRKVYDALASSPVESSELLGYFQTLYDLEDRAKTQSPEERVEFRQSESLPVWQQLNTWLQSERANKALPKSPLSAAVNYIRNHWDYFQVYLDDGLLPIDNNDAEQLMKQVATGRKNWLFVGSVAAGERAADFMSLVSSAVRNDLDVWAYVKDVLDHLLADSTDYHSLRPDIWAQSHPDSIRTYRVRERSQRADRTRRRRALRRAKHTS